VAALSFFSPSIGWVGVCAVVIALVAGGTIQTTLYGVREPSELPPQRNVLAKILTYRRRSANMVDTYRPRWVLHTLRATGWPVRRVAFVLVALLALDTGLLAVLAVTGCGVCE